MSGSGRKSAYRKGVTKKVLYDHPEPRENEAIVRVVALRGSNLFEVQHADASKSLTMLPTKFRKLIWVKRGDFLIVSGGDGDITTSEGKKGAVTSIVEAILYKDQIKNLRAKGLWPVELDELAAQESASAKKTTANDEDEDDDEDEEEEEKSGGIQMVATDSLFVNRNRRRGVIEDEEEEEDSDED
ncbi:hypothetical protein Poli38472_013863 [Pythium oligandrum]|uniref:S1-like domain-containing protein n=1 Tax=Pythium oligandrum TaxID=41045 RepID=A0A8K1C280_PYTOL|nr:hypothetical protein Poli38472_013863 [Pythium oligandrum]|eukprot:TMW55101.1 hypothetical protein Poli38472_013863 [Pythium oligandrum]